MLSAIRRLIAEDEALTAARDLRTHGSAATLIEHAEALPIAVGGDVLAQRHGGNAALARQIAGRSLSSVSKMRHAGRSADIQAAAMRAALQAPLSDIDDGADDEWFIAVESPLRAATKAAAAPAAEDAGPTASSAAPARLAGGFRRRWRRANPLAAVADHRAAPRPRDARRPAAVSGRCPAGRADG